MLMQHPMFCGSLLYAFFGGPMRFASLVNTRKEPVRFGPEVTLGGQQCRTVRFYAAGPYYGRTEIAIGIRDGLIRRIRYGSEPLLEAMRKSDVQQMLQRAMENEKVKENLKGQDLTKIKIPSHSETTELYSHLVVNRPISTVAFDPTL